MHTKMGVFLAAVPCLTTPGQANLWLWGLWNRPGFSPIYSVYGLTTQAGWNMIGYSWNCAMWKNNITFIIDKMEQYTFPGYFRPAEKTLLPITTTPSVFWIINSSVWSLCLSPDQHDQALLQTSVLGRASSVAGDWERWELQAAGPSHLPHPQLHPTHRVSALPPAAQRPLQTGAAVLRWGTFTHTQARLVFD